jgi:hypothetical protein
MSAVAKIMDIFLTPSSAKEAAPRHLVRRKQLWPDASQHRCQAKLPRIWATRGYEELLASNHEVSAMIVSVMVMYVKVADVGDMHRRQRPLYRWQLLAHEIKMRSPTAVLRRAPPGD